MANRTDTFGLRETTVGHARIGGIDVAYLECPRGDGRAHWFVGIDAGGAAIGTPLTDGPLVPGRPDAGRGEIEAHLARIAANPPRDVYAAAAAEQALVSFRGRLLLTGMMEEAGLEDVRVDAAIRAETSTLKERLGDRAILLVHYVNSHSRRSLAPHGNAGSRRDAAIARLLSLPASEVGGLAAMALSPLFREIVESGLPLDRPVKEVVAELLPSLGVPRASVGRIPGEVHPTPHLVRALQSFPVDWIPRSDDRTGWTALSDVAYVLDVAEVPPGEWRTLADSSKGDWPSFVRRCALAAYRSEIEFVVDSLTMTLRSASDMTSAFSAFLLTMAGESDIGSAMNAADIAREATRGERNLPSLLEASTRWHERFSSTAPSGIEWKPLLPAWTDVLTGIQVVPLGTSDALVEEGVAMEHCVGGESFTLKSLRDTTRIVSLRRGGDRLTTAEIDLDARGLSPGVLQHFGPSNSRPLRDAAKALNRYMDLASVTQARLNSRPNGKSLPPRSHEGLTALLEEWRPYLTGRWKSATLAEFHEAVVEMDEVIPMPMRR